MKPLWALLCFVLAMLAGCGEPTPETVQEPVVLVALVPAVTGDLPVVIRSYGRVEFDPAGKHTLNTEIQARVLDLAAVPGDRVEQGQVVVHLAPSATAGTEVNRARRDATAARAVAERTKRLRSDGLASDADVEAANTTARDLLEQALSLESRSGAVLSLRAPAGGVVDGIFAAPGDLIAPGAPIVQLASPEALQARIGIEVEDVSRVAVGATVALRSLDKSGAQVNTVVQRIDQRIDPQTRMAAALVTIPPGRGFLAGEAVAAAITAGKRTAVVVVPRASVFYDETGFYVFVALDGTAALRRVETGVTSGEQTEIRKGVVAGDTIVVAGAATLSDGVKIRTAARQGGP